MDYMFATPHANNGSPEAYADHIYVERKMATHDRWEKAPIFAKGKEQAHMQSEKISVEHVSDGDGSPYQGQNQQPLWKHCGYRVHTKEAQMSW
jgi:hypothetical protein